MIPSLREELEKVANPDVAEAITKTTSRLANELAGVLGTISSKEQTTLLLLINQTMLEEIESRNKKLERRRLSEMKDESALSHQLNISSGLGEKLKITDPDLLPTCEVPSEVLELAKREFNDQETTAEIRRIRESGGLSFNDFFEELERLARSNK